MDQESDRRLRSPFAQLTPERQTAIADDIAYLDRAKPELKTAAEFFAKFRNLVAGGYYATPKGWKDIGYVGNVPTVAFGGPPRKVLEQLGVTGA